MVDAGCGENICLSGPPEIKVYCELPSSHNHGELCKCVKEGLGKKAKHSAAKWQQYHIFSYRHTINILSPMYLFLSVLISLGGSVRCHAHSDAYLDFHLELLCRLES